jgi:hypothetical protein
VFLPCLKEGDFMRRDFAKGGGRGRKMDALSDGALMSNDDIFPYIRGISNKLSCLRRQGTKRRQLIIFMIFCSSHVFTITNTFVPERQPLLPYHQEKQRTKEEARSEKECIESVLALRWREQTVEWKPCWVDITIHTLKIYHKFTP